MKEYYRQCRLTSENKETTAWIPEYGAKVGNTLTLDDSEGRWAVVEVSSIRMLKDDIKKSNVFESIKKIK